MFVFRGCFRFQFKTPKKKEKGIKGDIWSIHGGGIYEFNKYSLAPPSWPATLHWSKWEAYTTWITDTLSHCFYIEDKKHQ